ncbi:MAG: SMC-Scp complex subunit ScpB [Candidatus Margulisbacteria bacterium]|jgi:segregation and condensation protein B|nr:SMC-Scp complex subunit ScpB [Candidatus Margulisiibacteriota bacterium]
MPKLKARLEVLLFMARQPLTLEQLARYLEVSGEETQRALTELAGEYAAEEHGLQIVNVAGGWQFATKPECAKPLELYLNAPQEFSLSPAALETLVIIAYRQPVSKSEIEAVRGINSDWIVKSLQDKELIEEQGRSENIGRPLLYGTTAKFLKHFGLRDLQDLPPEPNIQMQAQPELIAAGLQKFAAGQTAELAFSGEIKTTDLV